jgi:cellulose synthase/poly-beta-1,6-N-acetylglucosamine synthase-like glycosyltransferase
METFVSCALATFASLLAIPVIVFCLEIIAALALPQHGLSACQSSGFRRRVAVLIPAHNESTGILPTLVDLQTQLHAGDRLLVVADNCSDDTAAVASAAGARVVERCDPARFGKGYALDFGLRQLAADPPDVVVVVDADCRLGKDAIDWLATSCAMTGRPAQALYLMTAPDGSAINYRVAEFAWRVKNWLRPLGLSALGLPCPLAGTGMAFPWDVIRSADLAHGWIVEDLKLGLDLAAAGHPPLFCPSAYVTSQFAASLEGAKTQRDRWEQGHMHTILKGAPRMILRALARCNLALLVLTLDLMIPPLSLLGLLLLSMLSVSALTASFGFSSAALKISVLSLLAFVAAAFLAWLKSGRDVVPPNAIWLVGPYVIGKLGLYGRFLSGKIVMEWIRTDRRKSG